jgi:hypothetical protein
MTATTEENPRVVGATAVHLVGVEGTIEAIGDGTITIDGVTLPNSIAGPVRLIAMRWPTERAEPDHDERVPEEDYSPLEVENLRLHDSIIRLHDENHPGPIAVCLHEVCRRINDRR